LVQVQGFGAPARWAEATVADAMHVGLVSRTPDNLWLGWWWAEYAAALALLYFVVREAREAVEAARGGNPDDD